MQGLVFVGGQKGVELKSCPVPEITKPDQVLVRIKGAGICGTDVSVIKGNFPVPLGVIMGHEAAGIVEKLGKNCGDLKVGDRVGINPVKGCSHCKYCGSGRPNLCKEGGVVSYMGLSPVNGALTEYVVMPHDLLVKLPDDLSLETAVLCETMSTVIRGIDQMKPFDKETEILILGGGITGLLAATYLTDEGFRKFTVCQRSKTRQEKVRKQCEGFEVVVKGPEELQQDFERNSEDNYFGFDVIFESTGNPEAVEKSLDYLKPGGKLVIFGCCPTTAKIQFSPFNVFCKELTIVGSFIQPNTYERAVEKIVSLDRKKRLDFDVIGVKTFALANYKEALDLLKAKSISKAIIV